MERFDAPDEPSVVLGGRATPASRRCSQSVRAVSVHRDHSAPNALGRVSRDRFGETTLRVEMARDLILLYSNASGRYREVLHREQP